MSLPPERPEPAPAPVRLPLPATVWALALFGSGLGSLTKPLFALAPGMGLVLAARLLGQGLAVRWPGQR
jgi:hypothetical protein